ncbi:hypothetical protein QUF80_20105 [Desulfococcaceae bacterium HSG8]|nr:hypothetical protein [Desulfococcaceae bacterium HSG8]
MQKVSGRRIILNCCLCVCIMFAFLADCEKVFASEPFVVKIRPFREKNIDYTKEYKYQLLDLVLRKTVATDGHFRIEVVKNPGPRIWKI